MGKEPMDAHWTKILRSGDGEWMPGVKVTNEQNLILADTFATRPCDSHKLSSHPFGLGEALPMLCDFGHARNERGTNSLILPHFFVSQVTADTNLGINSLKIP